MHGIGEVLWPSILIWILIIMSELVSDNSKEYVENKFLYYFTWLWHFGREINVASLFCGIGIQINLIVFFSQLAFAAPKEMSVIRIIYMITLLEVFLAGIVLGVINEAVCCHERIKKAVAYGFSLILLLGLVSFGFLYSLVFEKAAIRCLTSICIVFLELIGGIIYILYSLKNENAMYCDNAQNIGMNQMHRVYYFRETVDIREEHRVIESAGHHVKYEYVYTTSKKVKTPSKLVVFMPEAYGISQDVDGNIYDYYKQKGWKLISNMGAYQELSDCLVREGYATIRCQRVKERKLLKQIRVSSVDIFTEVPEFREFAGEIYVLAHGMTWIGAKELQEKKKIAGLISLCGTDMPQKDKKICEEQYESVIDDFIHLATQIPVFAGYVEYDPYSNRQMIEEIKRRTDAKIAYHYFSGTDFSLRHNKGERRKGVTVWRQKSGKRTEPLNSEVADSIINWLNGENK